MLPAPLHPQEALRQAALDDLEVVDTPAEHCLDTLVRLAQELFGVETVLVSLVDRDRQWFKARVGMDVPETPRDFSFCGHAILGQGPLLVSDAREDARFVQSPLVCGAPHVRFYAGQPLFASNGLAIGTLCLLDPKPRKFSPSEQKRLRDLATLAEGFLQLHNLSRQAQSLRQAVGREQRKALIDPLTQLWNRGGLAFFQGDALKAATAQQLRLGVLYCDLDYFKSINDQYGHGGGDQVLRESAQRLSAALRPQDMVTRHGGEEFVVLSPVRDDQELRQIAERIRRAIAAPPIVVGAAQLSLTVSIGGALTTEQETIESALNRADQALYRAKHNGRNRVELSD